MWCQLLSLVAVAVATQAARENVTSSQVQLVLNFHSLDVLRNNLSRGETGYSIFYERRQAQAGGAVVLTGGDVVMETTARSCWACVTLF